MKKLWIGGCLFLLTACNNSENDTFSIASKGEPTQPISTYDFAESLDPLQREDLQRQNPYTLRKLDRGTPLNISDVVNMVKAHINDDAIIGHIEMTNSLFHLTTSDIIYLQRIGVSQRVIDAMITSTAFEMKSRC